MTAAQRRCLLALPSNPQIWATTSEMRGDGATGAGLDVLYIYHVQRDERVCDRRWTRWGGERGQRRGEGYEYRITPIGLAVREILTASAMSAGTAETAQQAQGRSPASAVGAEGAETPNLPPSGASQ